MALAEARTSAASGGLLRSAYFVFRTSAHDWLCGLSVRRFAVLFSARLAAVQLEGSSLRAWEFGIRNTHYAIPDR